MTIPVRIALAAYLLVLTIGLLAGQWPLQGPLLVGAGGHGIHAGDVVVLAVSTIAAIIVLTANGTRR